MLRLRVTARLLSGSLADHPVVVTPLSERGWVREEIVRIEHDPDALTLSVTLAEQPESGLVRVIVRGTGPTPGSARTRGCRWRTGRRPACGEDDGHDAVLTLRTSRTAHGPAEAADEHVREDGGDAT